MNTPAFPELFSAVVALSWRAGWLILVLAVLRRLVRGRVPAQVWFVAWILVALRLLLPFSLPVSWSPYNLFATKPPVATAAVVATPPAAENATPSVPRESIPTTPPAALASLPASAPSPTWSRSEIFTAVWLVGLGFFVALRGWGLARFRRRLRDAQPVSDPRVTAIVDDELRQAGATLALRETRAIDAPALYGLFRPQLLLPPGLAAKLTDDELRHVVRHELGHWRRRDLLAQALMQATVAVHWFNPLVWLAARLARADCELACDELVLHRESSAGASAYGATLLKVLGVVRARRQPAAVVAMLESKEQLAQRLRLIADHRATTLGRVCVGVALVGALAALSFTRESRADETPKSVTPPVTAPTKPSGTLTLGNGQLKITPANSPTADSADEAKRSGDVDRQERLEQGRRAFDALKTPTEEQRQKVDRLHQQLQAYKEKNGLVSLDSRRDIINETLKALNLEAVRTKQALNVAEQRLDQVRTYRASKADLTTLPFIANQPSVAALMARAADLKVQRSTLSERYREQHPQMLQLAKSLAATETQLSSAIDAACAQLESECQAIRGQHEQVLADLEKQKQEALAVDRLAIEYGRLERELRANEQVLNTIAARSLDTVLSANSPAQLTRGEKLDDFTVSVMGAVNQQGGIRFSTADKPILLDAIARAGGFGPTADRNAVRVIRLNSDDSRSTHTVNEATLMAGRDDVGVLRRGDIVVVPEKVVLTVNVVGQVNQPGVIEFQREGTLVEAIVRAGGPTRLANLKKVVLKRFNADGSLEVININVAEIMQGESRDTWPLKPRDVITVPERTL